MAQLIKLHNYISRYERGIYHYPGQFIRLKQEKWKKENMEWENTKKNPVEKSVEESKTGWKNILKRNSKSHKEAIDEEVNEVVMPSILTDKEKKQMFLDSLYPFQLKWASSTISQMSFLDGSFKQDEVLKYFLQRFPDTYLLFYHPVFTLKNVTMETDILLVGPYGIDIIKITESDRGHSYTALNERTWFIEADGIQKRILSPILSLNRTERVIKGILHLYGNDFPVRKIVLSRKNEIYSTDTMYNTSYISGQMYSDWLKQKREDAHLLKHRQLHVCELLLSHCDSVAFQRPEWEKSDAAVAGDFTIIS